MYEILYYSDFLKSFTKRIIDEEEKIIDLVNRIIIEQGGF